MESLKPYLIVDGWNTWHAWKQERLLKAGEGREAIIAWCRRWRDTTGSHTVVVFDGKGASASFQSGALSPFFEVMDTPSDVSADGAIEYLLLALPKVFQICVVTADRAIAQSAQIACAEVWCPMQFWESIQESREKFDRRLKGWKSKWKGGSIDI